MALADSKIQAVIAVSDMGKAKEFYEGKLGLSGGEDGEDGGTTYPLGGDSRLHVYPSPGNAGSSGATIAAFIVDDVEASVDELSGNGITFEQYDQDPIKTDKKGIASFGDDKVAWFKDPDGNIVAISND